MAPERKGKRGGGKVAASRKFPEAAQEKIPPALALRPSPALGDILRPGLAIVFIGYNPSIPAFRSGHYYANPGNRFYTLLFESGLTPRLLTPQEDRLLPDFGLGATDLLPLPSARADQIPAEKFREAVPLLREKLSLFAPRAVCCNGVGVYRHIFGEPPPRLGRIHEKTLGTSAVFVSPSTSGLANGFSRERRAVFQELALFKAEERGT